MPSARLRAVCAYAPCALFVPRAAASHLPLVHVHAVPSSHSCYRVPSRPPMLTAGKSAVGMLSYLACAAKCQPVVYIPRGGDWVTAATESRGDGDAFFLLTLLKQNAGECSTAALVVTI